MEPYVQMNTQIAPATTTAQASSRAFVGAAAAVEDGGRRREEAGAESAKAAPLSADATRALTGKVESALRSQGVDLKFVVNEEAGQIQVEIRDAASEKLIRKIPQDELINLQESLKKLAGALYDRPV
ncbi:flagellar protein FlaG [Desulfovibrio aminophilus]|nr:flagellar protein FlaG [Desulfovibrio aminophilus]MCM0755526.1 flagellar protein FlaG [Desulfovibrio aminophilus]